jgi:nicotinate-nucleotide adenylyltransferase
MRIGIFGGSFDPVHNGHISVAKLFIEKFGLEKCIVHPANISPFKADAISKISNEHRMNLINLAFEDTPEVVVDNYELNKGGVSFTIEFVEYLNDIYPNAKFYLLIGTDQAVHFQNWKDYQRIIEFVTLVIENRNQEMNEVELSELLESYPQFKKPKLLEVPAIDISSSLIRERLTDGKSIEGLVPDKVNSYIIENNLYL